MADNTEKSCFLYRDVDDLTDGTLTDEDMEDHEDLNLAYIRHMITGEALSAQPDTSPTQVGL